MKTKVLKPKFNNINNLANQPVELGFGERNDGQASYPDEWRVDEELVGFDLLQRLRRGDGFSDFDGHDWFLWIGIIHRNQAGRANGGLLVARVIDDQLTPLWHLA